MPEGDASILQQLGYLIFLIGSVLLYDLIYILWHGAVLLPTYNKKFPSGRSVLEFYRERLRDALRRNAWALIFGLGFVVSLRYIGVAKPFIVGSLVALTMLGVAWTLKAVDILSSNPRIWQAVGVEIDSVQLSVSILKPMVWGVAAVLTNLAYPP
jgi:hypothetical protein